MARPDSPLRILVATDQWYPDLLGGVARVAAETSSRWAAAGLTVTVLAPESAAAAARSESGGLELIRSLPRGRLPQTLVDPLATRRAANRLSASTWDVAVAHTMTT